MCVIINANYITPSYRKTTMLKLAVLLFLSAASAKLINPKYDYLFYEQFNSVVETKPLPRKVPPSGAWVLSLSNDVEDLKLRVATSDEVRGVFPVSRINSGLRQGRTVKKEGPIDQEALSTEAPEMTTKIDFNEKVMISEIMRVINKFALNTHTEPHLVTTHYKLEYILEGDDNSPTIQLYFKGIQTSLVVRAEGRQWHYVIGPPPLFPEWFYEDHPNISQDSKGAFVEVPKDVKKEFYSVLFHMLTMFASFPV